MAYVYESIQNGIFKFTIPGENRTVTLFKGSRVTVKQKLSGSYSRVLKFIEEIPDEPNKKEDTKPNAKVEDKITKVKEVVETPTEKVEVKMEDKISDVGEKSTEQEETTTSKRRTRRKK